MDKSSKNSDTNNIKGELFSILRTSCTVQVSQEKSKPIDVSFTAPDLSSQGGLLLMSDYEQRFEFVSKLSACINDTRYQPIVQHPYYEMFKQRIFRIAAGYRDADDCDLLRGDSILKLCSGRLPDDKALSSQPTMSRLENIVTDREQFQYIRRPTRYPFQRLLRGVLLHAAIHFRGTIGQNAFTASSSRSS